jgi:hypothetical protein
MKTLQDLQGISDGETRIKLRVGALVSYEMKQVKYKRSYVCPTTESNSQFRVPVMEILLAQLKERYLFRIF